MTTATKELTNDFYYIPPTHEIFDEVKEAAIDLWSTYDDTYGYASAKINQIKDLRNVHENVMYIVGMFDINNQYLLADKLSDEASEAIRTRLEAGGTLDEFNPF